MNLYRNVIHRTAHKRNLQDGDVSCKTCKTCKYRDGPSFDYPCLTCSSYRDFNNWEGEE